MGSCDHMRAMLDFAASGLDIPPNGPTAVLLARVRRLGWTLHSGGVIRDIFGSVGLFDLSRGLLYCDVAEIRRVLAKLGDADRAMLLCCLNGTMYHDVHKKKHERGRGSLCTYCGHVDSGYLP